MKSPTIGGIAMNQGDRSQRRRRCTAYAAGFSMIAGAALAVAMGAAGPAFADPTTDAVAASTVGGGGSTTEDTLNTDVYDLLTDRGLSATKADAFVTRLDDFIGHVPTTEQYFVETGLIQVYNGLAGISEQPPDPTQEGLLDGDVSALLADRGLSATKVELDVTHLNDFLGKLPTADQTNVEQGLQTVVTALIAARGTDTAASIDGGTTGTGGELGTLDTVLVDDGASQTLVTDVNDFFSFVPSVDQTGLETGAVDVLNVDPGLVNLLDVLVAGAGGF
jgi:hypothetical protein